jgi:hypothetical protein
MDRFVLDGEMVLHMDWKLEIVVLECTIINPFILVFLNPGVCQP